MKKKFILPLLLSLLNTSIFAEDQDPKNSGISTLPFEMSEELDNQNLYTDPILDVKEFIFKHHQIKTLLEFGVGRSTKFFLDSSDKVISIEFVTHGAGPEQIKNCLNLYQDYANWIPIVYFTGYRGDMSWAPYKYIGSESVYKATSYQTATHQDYALIDPFYVTELNAFIANLVKCHRVDLAYVDSGLYLRGDLIQQLFGKVSLIIAHDTDCRAASCKEDVYGYSRIIVPEEYEEIYVSGGQGITVWVLKNEQFQQFAEELKQYAEQVNTGEI